MDRESKPAYAWIGTAVQRSLGRARSQRAIAYARSAAGVVPIDLVSSMAAAERITAPIVTQLDAAGYRCRDDSGRLRHLAILPSEALYDRRSILAGLLSLVSVHPQGQCARMWTVTGGARVPLDQIRDRAAQIQQTVSDWSSYARQRWHIDVVLAKTEITIDQSSGVPLAHVHGHLILIPCRRLTDAERDAPIRSLRKRLNGAHVHDDGILGRAKKTDKKAEKSAANAAQAAAYAVKYLTKCDEIAGLSRENTRIYAEQVEGLRVLRPMGSMRKWRSACAAAGLTWRAVGSKMMPVLPKPAEPKLDIETKSDQPREPYCRAERSYRRIDDQVRACLLISGPGRHSPGPISQKYIEEGQEWVSEENARLDAGIAPASGLAVLAESRGFQAEPPAPPIRFTLTRHLRTDPPSTDPPPPEIDERAAFGPPP